MSDLLIQAQNLNTYYGASHILRGVNFSVGQGETIGLMGRNGMGKSTLLKSIMGIVPPRTGTVDIKGQRMNGRPTFEVAQMGIAYVPEGRGIFGNLSVVENLQMAARVGRDGRCDWPLDRARAMAERLFNEDSTAAPADVTINAGTLQLGSTTAIRLTTPEWSFLVTSTVPSMMKIMKSPLSPSEMITLCAGARNTCRKGPSCFRSSTLNSSNRALCGVTSRILSA